MVSSNRAQWHLLCQAAMGADQRAVQLARKESDGASDLHFQASCYKLPASLADADQAYMLCWQAVLTHSSPGKLCFRSTLDGLLQIIRKEGVPVLYRGMDLNLMVGVPMVRFLCLSF